AAAALTAMSPALALLGWAVDSPGLKALWQPVPMSPATAVCLILCGAALWVLRDRRTSARGAAAAPVAVARAAALFVAAVGALKLAELCGGFESGVDRVLFGSR